VARRVYTRRYSQAVFEIALETEELDRWQSDLRRMASLAEEPAIISFLESPKVYFDDKARLLSEQLPGINPVALNLVYLLADKGRLAMLGDIAGDYERLLNNYLGIETAEVITAIPLNEEDKLKLAEHLGAMVSKKVALKTEVDARLIGGIIARIGGKLLDGSTRSKLEALKKDLIGAGR